MSAVKEKMIKIINEQPDDSSYYEILQELSFVNMVNKGLDDSRNNSRIDTDTLKKEVENW